MDLASNSDLISNHSKQAHPDEVDHSSEGGDLSSIGDITGAVLVDWKGGGGGGDTSIPEPEYDIKPIEHSAQIRQAKARVQNWEGSVEDGSMSNAIFNPQDMSVPQRGYGTQGTEAEDKYNFDATEGVKGIGTPNTNLGSDTATDAAAAFVNEQVSNTKKKFNFQPAS